MSTTVTITLKGIARTVTLHVVSDGTHAYAHGAVATIGRGAARYPAELTLWRIEENARPGSWTHRQTAERSSQVVTDSEGVDWAVSTSATPSNPAI